MEHLELLDVPLGDLMSEAARLRDAAHGSRVTFSPKVFIPLTMLCRDRCGYCTFAKPPAHLDSPYLSIDDVLDIARRGAAVGCHEALFTLGEAPEERYPAAAHWLAAHGYASTVDYLVGACAAVLEETGLLPHANAGALSRDDLERLRAVSPSQGMMIETLAARLGEPGGPHAGAPDKTPERRLATLEAAGEAAVPFTTGILVGIGETRAERLEALLAIRDAHARHGHVQEVIVQNFLPKPGTAMWRHDACDRHEFLWTVAAARILLGPDAHLQAPPNLSDPDELGALVAAGIDDWGGVSPVTPDHVNPERPWPALDALRAATEAAGKTLAPRLTVYPEYVRDPEQWLDPAVRFAVLCASDSEGLARDDAWAAGGDEAPPRLLASPPPRLSPPVPTPQMPTPSRGGRRSARCSPAWSRARTSTSTRSSRCSKRAAPSSDRSPTWPTSCAATSSATSSPSSAPATSTTRTSARSSAGSARSRRARSPSTCVATRTDSSSTRSSAASSKRSSAARPRSASRAASTPTSTASTTSPSRAR